MDIFKVLAYYATAVGVAVVVGFVGSTLGVPQGDVMWECSTLCQRHGWQGHLVAG